jgi:hypothetical protein
VRLRSSASAYFNRTPAGAGNRTTWTWSAWIKLGKTTGYQYFFGATSDNYANNFTLLQMNNGTSDLAFYDVQGGATKFDLRPTQLFRDPSAWYHLVLVYDSSNATSSDRVRMYVNGSRITAFSSATYPTSSQTSVVNSVTTHNISTSPYGVDGYLTEINFIDGQALTPSSFGETDSITGVWKPKAYSGTYGTNGFELNFSDNSNNTAATIGKDYSGNGNNWTPNNISVTAGTTYDSMTDVPTLTSATAANYCVMNPVNSYTADQTVTDGNLKVTTGVSALYFGSTFGTIGVSSGKWYWEYSVSASQSPIGGIALTTLNANTTNPAGTIASGVYGYYSANGNKRAAGVNTAYGATYTSGDIIGVALDLDAGTLTYYKNNASQGTAFTGLSGTFAPVIFDQATGNSITLNFGQRPFSYTPPTGFVALNTYNLPDSTIKNGAAYMAATLYTGNGGTQTITNSVNGISFQPDFVWAKNRTNAIGNALFDSVRGTGLQIVSNSTGAETNEGSFGVSAFNSNGFNVGANSSVNQSSASMVGWQWKAGGTSSSNTNGSITSTVSAGATQGFSVVTYSANGSTGTVGHGLGVAPSMIIVKKRNAVERWCVFHTSTSNAYIYLNETFAAETANANLRFGNNTVVVQPTSTLFTIGSSNDVNGTSGTYVAYCFAAVAGYSAFGSYTGNGSTDGVFVYTGFQPRWIMVKQSSAAGEDWLIQDTSRKPYNTSTTGVSLAADTSGAEVNSSAQLWDVLSNGFKLRASGGGVNASGATYIYMAFASNPFRNALAR